MESFRKVPSILARFLIEVFAVLMFPVFVTGLINELWPGTLAPQYDIDGTDWLYAIAGPLLVIAVLRDIVSPRVKIEGWVPYIGRFEICSTHPSYVLVDVMTIFFAAFYYWLGITAKFEMAAFRIMLGTAFLFPAVRLTAWYVFGRTIDRIGTIDAYKPPLISFGIFLAVIAIATTAALLT